MTSRCCEVVRSDILATARLFVYFACVFGDGRNESTGTYTSSEERVGLLYQACYMRLFRVLVSPCVGFGCYLII